MNTTEVAVNPYRVYEGTPQWKLLDTALRQLTETHAVEEISDHAYLVGYLCNALTQDEQDRPSLEQRLEALRHLREAVKQAGLSDRDLVGELLQERRAEAAREEAGL